MNEGLTAIYQKLKVWVLRAERLLWMTVFVKIDDKSRHLALL
jgi:hypothetical protein